MKLLKDLKFCSVLVIISLFTLNGNLVWISLLLYTIVVALNMFYNVQKIGILKDERYVEKLGMIIPLIGVAAIALVLAFISGYLQFCK